MTDNLVERLRANASWGYDIAADAADEIERLRAALKSYACRCAEKSCETGNHSDVACGHIARTALGKTK
jgi:hypothetical protein